MRRAGYRFDVVRPAVSEAELAGESPADMVARLAEAKARAVVGFTGTVVLGADTTVSLDGEALAKPASSEDAVRMLMRLSGREHEVLTGYALARDRSIVARGIESSSVSFFELDEDAAEAYVATGEPLDKAGGYAIQGIGRRFVSGIEGSFTNVMGLPMERIEVELGALGIEPMPRR